MPADGKLGLLSALAAYVALLCGMLAIGGPAQQQGIVAGLWITEALAIALPAGFVLALAGVRFAPYLGFRGISWKHVVVAVAVAAANQPVVSFVTWAARDALPQALVQDFDAKQRMLDAIFRMHAVPMAITVTVAAPLGEEIFFRGFALPAVRRSVGLLAALVISGALFSFLHMDPVGFAGLMEIGILLGALRVWSGSLWPAVIGHAVNNGIAGGAFLLGLEDPDMPPTPPILILGALLLAAGIWLLSRLLRANPPSDSEELPGGPGRPTAAILALIWILAMIWGVHAWMVLRGKMTGT